jgi:predicted short-subunit dehydrogenase-like oxidoreductase (DUF2520 family)
MMEKPSLGFVGLGKVGIPLARLWYAAGYTVRAVQSRSFTKAAELAARVAAEAVLTPDEVVAAADLTLLTVPDDVVVRVAATIEQRDLRGKAVIHAAGARDATVLDALAERGALVGSLHPVFPFADVETTVENLPGAVFAVEGESPVLRRWLIDLVEALRGHSLAVPAGQKAAYHSALVFASNYTVTLYWIAERLLMGLGAEQHVADQALNGLLHGTVANLQQKGVPDALTGPLVRGDTGTLEAHLAALEKTPYGQLYRELVRQSYPMLAARQIDTDSIERVLRQNENHAIDNP